MTAGRPPEPPRTRATVSAVRPCGPRAVLVEVPDHHHAIALAEWLRAQQGLATEIVPGACTVLVDGLLDGPADAGGPRERLRVVLAEWDGEPAPPVPLAPVRIPVVYDGPDLARIADLWGVGVDEVVARHTRVAFVSAFCGFAPGFSYLAGLPAEWAVPRLASPRERVPPGAVALADRWCGIYPSASPGGWLVLGRADVRLWDSEREEPALLPPGTPVRFVAS